MKTVKLPPSRGLKNGSASTPVGVIIPRVNLQTATITLAGDSALICHKWSEKAKAEMLGKQMGKAKTAKEHKDPWADFCQSLYWLTQMPAHPTETDVAKASFGFPVVAFKAAAVDACSHIDGVTKVEARGAFHINGEFVELKGQPTLREDMVRIGMGTADIRHRGEFKQWKASLVIRFNANVLSLEQIVNLFATAGFAIGVGEWRPQKDGSYGMFHVE